MKKILSYLFVVALTILIADRSFYYFFTRYVFVKTLNGDSGGAINYSLQKGAATDFFILGSSRAKYHINPAALKNLYDGNGYNAGKNGLGGIVYNNMTLHLIIDKGIIPKTVIFQTDPQTFFSTGVEDFSNELLPLYPFIEDSKYLSGFIYKNSNYEEKIKLFFKSYRYNGKFFGVWYNYLERNSFKQNNGFEMLTGKIDTSMTLPVQPLVPPKYSTEKINLLKDMVQTCNDHKIKLVVVLPPTYKNIFFNDTASNFIIKVLHEAGNVSVYDFSDINRYPVLTNSALWRDVSHLNGTGAAIFTRLLNDSMPSIH